MKAFILTIFVIYAVALVFDVVLAVVTESRGENIKPSAVVRMVAEVGVMIWGGFLLWGVS